MQEDKQRTAEEIAEETLATLKSIERATKTQSFYTKVCASGTIATALLVIVAVIAGMIAYHELQVGIEDAMLQIDALAEQVTTVEFEEMKDGLSEMVENIDGLVSESRDGINTATEIMLEMDVDALNDAIADLQAVIEPLANFFNMF